MARVWHRWKPQITVDGTHGALHYSVTFTLQARATIDGSCFRQTAWQDPPPAEFETYWDPDASFIAWTVSGSETSGDKHYTYSGAGQRSFGERDGGGLRTEQGATTVELSLHGPITWTVTETSPGSSTTHDNEANISVLRTGVGLSANWTVGAASFQQVGLSGTENVSWSEFSADPPFDNAMEPR
jgi:hypothetical protein